MPLNSNLTEYLAGIYRFGKHYRIFPRPGVRDWYVTNSHELTHCMLATATTSGFFHSLLAFLAHSPLTAYSEHWKYLFKNAIDFSRKTHEAAATFISLGRVAKNLGLEEASRLKGQVYTIDRLKSMVI